jgi:hypothetical protein
MTDVAVGGLVRSFVVAGDGILYTGGLVREFVGAPGVGANQLLVGGIVREFVVVPAGTGTTALVSTAHYTLSAKPTAFAGALSVGRAIFSLTARAVTLNAQQWLTVTKAALNWSALSPHVVSALLAIAAVAFGFTARAITLRPFLAVAKASLTWTVKAPMVVTALGMAAAALGFTALAARLLVIAVGPTVLKMARVTLGFRARTVLARLPAISKGGGARYQIIIPKDAPTWAQQMQAQFNAVLARIQADIGAKE